MSIPEPPPPPRPDRGPLIRRARPPAAARRRARRRAADLAALQSDYEAGVRDRLYGGPRSPAISEIRPSGSR